MTLLLPPAEGVFMRLWAAAALNALSLQPEEEGREKGRVYGICRESRGEGSERGPDSGVT